MEITDTDRAALRRAMNDRLGLDEVQSICYDLGISYDNLSGDTKLARTISLLERVERTGRGADLIAWLRENRPDVVWPDPYSSLVAASSRIKTGTSAEVQHDADMAAQLERFSGLRSKARPIGFLLRSYALSRPICRVVGQNWTASGFLVNSNLLITNNHVISNPETAQSVRIEFNYETNEQGVDQIPDVYKLDPDAGFATSLTEDKGGDDWTAVRVKGDPAAKWGTLPLVLLPDGTPKVNDELVVMGHPGGGRKQIITLRNLVVYADTSRFQYLTDGAEGSSGAPVFDMDWKIVGLHHRGGWTAQPDTKPPVFVNQAIHINVVIAGLANANLL